MNGGLRLGVLGTDYLGAPHPAWAAAMGFDAADFRHDHHYHVQTTTSSDHMGRARPARTGAAFQDEGPYFGGRNRASTTQTWSQRSHLCREAGSADVLANHQSASLPSP
jgi:hypothetical protein